MCETRNTRTCAGYWGGFARDAIPVPRREGDNTGGAWHMYTNEPAKQTLVVSGDKKYSSG